MQPESTIADVLTNVHFYVFTATVLGLGITLFVQVRKILHVTIIEKQRYDEKGIRHN